MECTFLVKGVLQSNYLNIMNKINYLAVYVLACFVLLTSCGSDDDITPSLKITDVLTTSLTDYENASDNEWIAITEDEYNLLKQQANVSISGLSDASFAIKALTNASRANKFTHSNGGDEKKSNRIAMYLLLSMKQATLGLILLAAL